MIIDGRTIRNIAELREFCDAVIAQTKVDPAKIEMKRPISLRAHSHERDGHKSYDVETV